VEGTFSVNRSVAGAEALVALLGATVDSLQQEGKGDLVPAYAVSI